MKIHVCNNDCGGNWTKKISCFEFEVQGETALQVETRSMFPVMAEEFDPDWKVQLLRIHGITVKFSLIQTWTGNMMWNTIDMLDYYALGLLRALQLSKEWRVIEGWSDIFEKFERGEDITGKDFELDEDVQPRVVHENQLEIPF